MVPEQPVVHPTPVGYACCLCGHTTLDVIWPMISPTCEVVCRRCVDLIRAVDASTPCVGSYGDMTRAMQQAGWQCTYRFEHVCGEDGGRCTNRERLHVHRTADGGLRVLCERCHHVVHALQVGCRICGEPIYGEIDDLEDVVATILEEERQADPGTDVEFETVSDHLSWMCQAPYCSYCGRDRDC